MTAELSSPAFTAAKRWWRAGSGFDERSASSFCGVTKDDVEAEAPGVGEPAPARASSPPPCEGDVPEPPPPPSTIVAVPTLERPDCGDWGVDLPEAKSAREMEGMTSPSLLAPCEERDEKEEEAEAAAATSNVTVDPSAASFTILPAGSNSASTRNSMGPFSMCICSSIAATSLVPLAPTPAALLPWFRTLPRTLTLTLTPGLLGGLGG